MVLKLYAVAGSQPSRAVMWVLKMKGLKHELIKTIPPKDTQTPSFQAISVSRSVPAIVDDGFSVWDSAAILTYLSDKHGWQDLYPSELRARTEVNQWLHWHHMNSRAVQLAYGMPIMRPDLVQKGVWDKSSVLKAEAALHTLDRELGTRKFLASNEGVTLADIQIYQDVGQCQPQYLGALDFTPYPNLQRWMRDVAETAPEFAWLDAILKKVSAFYKKASKL